MSIRKKALYGWILRSPVARISDPCSKAKSTQPQRTCLNKERGSIEHEGACALFVRFFSPFLVPTRTGSPGHGRGFVNAYTEGRPNDNRSLLTSRHRIKVINDGRVHDSPGVKV